MKICLETFEEYPVSAKYKEGNKDSGFQFSVPGFWLKRKTRNNKPETGDKIFCNGAKGSVLQMSQISMITIPIFKDLPFPGIISVPIIGGSLSSIIYS